jgi:hypothetical protein
MSRKKQQAEMFTKLGALFGPLMKWAESPGTYDTDEKSRIFARFFAEATTFQSMFTTFTKSEPGHDYLLQYYQVANHLGPFASYAGQMTVADFCGHIQKVYADLFSAIFSIPVPVESAIHEAHTPFSTYCLLKDMCSTVIQRIIWMDRYFDATLFGRYFADVPRRANITLVTYPITQCKGVKDEQRYKDFTSVSKLFAQERGPSGYRLLTDTLFHDRWLECDSKMFVLGGSIKELGNATTFTVSKLDDTADNQRHFDDALARATEIFGPSQTFHP